MFYKILNQNVPKKCLNIQKSTKNLHTSFKVSLLGGISFLLYAYLGHCKVCQPYGVKDTIKKSSNFIFDPPPNSAP